MCVALLALYITQWSGSRRRDSLAGLRVEGLRVDGLGFAGQGFRV